ncbi:UspA domain protein [Natrialba magadii ATCC 43099]|uniref:UspA domain protein n=1 Tax=Natrialba magadii (strain ATCC 43099 / DSM 3394 / CCM 3739 / CIP 104546 / IAM 13178 / JCM 8861 / NBRC 102185 / NCIMB 2190 / MS3) TaxID=547559 RepID=D3SRU8_NATMM|nr:universal stress protein [Natrialba magadii]ADD06722.1 UspA domain protein [Natrialba magadii ATCC 43099]ELY32134.1 UspA domain-containing protein [Natrialba magadii ATCC 43099]
MYESLLVATDGSDDATAATAHGIGLASDLGAELYGVAVVESRTEYDNAIVDPDERERNLRGAAEDSLAAFGERARAADITAETAVRSGVPHEEILAAADRWEVDAIVVGARGSSEFKRALLGSTVDAVVRFADRPVLVVDGEGEGDVDENENEDENDAADSVGIDGT